MEQRGAEGVEILDKRQETLVTRERALIESLIEFLTGFGAPSGDVELLRRTLSDMGDPFLLVVVGEYNSGKSAYLNALLGEEVAKEGTLPTTGQVTVLKHSSEPTLREDGEGKMEKGLSSELLRAISVVDTPGTNAVIRHHEKLSREFVPRADLVIFVPPPSARSPRASASTWP
jgi:ribosome biogenesis GTPase A